MSDTLIRKWALNILQKSKKRSRYWPLVWIICAILFLLLYSYHNTEPILVGAVIFLFAAIIWAERKAFSEIIEEKDNQINSLKEKETKSNNAT